MENIVKTKLKNGQKTIGGFLQTLSPVAAEILSQCGFDWLIVDLEHAPETLPTCNSNCRR